MDLVEFIQEGQDSHSAREGFSVDLKLKSKASVKAESIYSLTVTAAVIHSFTAGQRLIINDCRLRLVFTSISSLSNMIVSSIAEDLVLDSYFKRVAIIAQT